MFEILGNLMNLIGLIGTIASIFTYISAKKIQKTIDREKQRLNQKIKVILKFGSDKKLIFQIRRQEISRAEILGRLGMLPMKEKGKRFSLDLLQNIEEIEKIQEGTEVSLIISCTKEELEQFAI